MTSPGAESASSKDSDSPEPVGWRLWALFLALATFTQLAFKLMFIEKDRVIDKFWGMRYPIGRDYNLFFLAWMEGIRFTIEHGAIRFQSGQTAYAQKVKLGSGLDKLWVYFRHRGRFTNRLFRTFAPLIAFDKMDPELAEIRQREKEKAKEGTA